MTVSKGAELRDPNKTIQQQQEGLEKRIEEKIEPGEKITTRDGDVEKLADFFQLLINKGVIMETDEPGIFIKK